MKRRDVHSAPPTAAGGAALQVPAPARASSDRAKALRLDSSRVHREAMATSQLSSAQVARALRKQPQHVRRWNADTQPHAPSIVDVVLGPVDWALPLIRWQAAVHLYEVWQRVRVVYGDDQGSRSVEVATSLAAVTHWLARTIGRELTDAELQQLAIAGRRAVEALREMVAHAEASLARRREP